ncbi:MAG: glycosyltransferase [Neomegalonema sp.]|nr:glycosyltransferase [Neomegalonema sp.]
MTSRRIIIVNDFKEGAGEPLFYDIAQHLLHGMIRAGHFVTRFSDRDLARAHGLGHKRFGVARAKKQLRALVETLRPDMILFGHADMFDAADFADLRALRPGVRLAQFNVDAPYRRETMAHFAARVPLMDASFFTAGELAPSAELFAPGGRIHFVPPLVDPAIDTGRAFDLPRDRAPRDAAFLGGVCEDRPAQLAALSAGLPTDFRFETHGMASGAARIDGAAYVDFLAQTPISPSLQPDSTQAEPLYYASTRVAQLLGNGVLGFVHHSTRLEALFGEGIQVYRGMEDLAEAMARFARDDDARRRAAQAGWARAFEIADAARACAYILAIAMGEDARPPWPEVVIST